MSKAKPIEGMTYEQAFKELEKVVASLEQGELQLEQALAEFERGLELSAHCMQLVEKAELKLRRLTSDEAGALAEEDFEPPQG